MQFKNPLKNMTLCDENEGPSVATIGPKGKAKGTGNFCLSWEDDKGMKHTHVLSNVYYIPDSPFDLFNATEFRKPQILVTKES